MLGLMVGKPSQNAMEEHQVSWYCPPSQAELEALLFFFFFFVADLGAYVISPTSDLDPTYCFYSSSLK